MSIVLAIYNDSFNQFEQRKGVILLFCVTVWTTMSMEKRKKTRGLSEEVRHNIVAKLGQSQGYKSISRDLIFLCPPYTMLSGSLRPMTPQPTSLDVAARESLIEDCSEGLFEMWRKHLDQLPNRFKLTFRHKVRQFQLPPSIANSIKGGSMAGDPGGPHC